MRIFDLFLEKSGANINIAYEWPAMHPGRIDPGFARHGNAFMPKEYKIFAGIT